MRDLFKEHIITGEVAADVGCGPHAGIFQELTFPIMYAVDPLWESYKDNNLHKIPENVQIISDTAESFILDDKADVIFSFNALDHSGHLPSSFCNIMDNLKYGGRFYFHIHLRTPEQLNFGHRMALTESDLDWILRYYNIVDKKILDFCPLDKKAYKSYIGVIEHGK